VNQMDINITAQKGMRTFVLVAITGVGVFLTVSAVQYGYQVWTRAEEPSEPLTPAIETIPTPIPTEPSSASGGSESLFESLVEKEEEPLGVLDYSEFVAAYGTADSKYDFNEDGIVDNEDFEIFKEKYQQAAF